jgi:hypothetical protein
MFSQEAITPTFAGAVPSFSIQSINVSSGLVEQSLLWHSEKRPESNSV